MAEDKHRLLGSRASAAMPLSPLRDRYTPAMAMNQPVVYSNTILHLEKKGKDLVRCNESPCSIGAETDV